jgi:DNA polymerase/3'-5' exonuclease PolX
MKNKLPYDHMLSIALPVVELLRPHCKRIELAGSLRRKKAEIGDIEIVAEPKEFTLDLFGVPTDTHSLDLFDWSVLGELKLDGHKQKKIVLPGDVQIDLFIVTPPAQWGVIYLLRTGSDKWSHRFVTAKSFGGMLPGYCKMRDGAIWSKDHIIETPDEKDLFDLVGVKFVPPQEREVP